MYAEKLQSKSKGVVFYMEDKQNKSNGLNKSLKLIFVYTVATGSIFTFVNYWDSVFYGYCGSGTFLAFALMTVAILPVARYTVSWHPCSIPQEAS